MLDPKANFYQARLKHVWANQHIKILHTYWQRFLQTDFAEVRVEDEIEDGKVIAQQLVCRSLHPLPAQILLVLGDAVHNLRCALDYTVNELLHWEHARIGFPTHKTREELISSFRTEPETVGQRTIKPGANSAIEKAVPGIGGFITDEIRPYRGGNSFLWALGKIDNTDKHRLLVPVLVPRTIGGINTVDDHDNRMIDCTATFDTLGVAKIIRMTPGNMKIESHGKPTAEIFLNEAGIIEGQPVLPTLVYMSQAVAETIQRIDEFATARGWKPRS